MHQEMEYTCQCESRVGGDTMYLSMFSLSWHTMHLHVWSGAHAGDEYSAPIKCGVELMQGMNNLHISSVEPSCVSKSEHGHHHDPSSWLDISL